MGGTGIRGLLAHRWDPLQTATWFSGSEVVGSTSPLGSTAFVFLDLPRNGVEGLKQNDREILKVTGLQVCDAFGSVSSVVTVLPNTINQLSEVLRKLSVGQEPIQPELQILSDLPSDVVRVALVFRVGLRWQKWTGGTVQDLSEHRATGVEAVDDKASRSLIENPFQLHWNVVRTAATSGDRNEHLLVVDETVDISR
ncbi:hypothetical protein [Microvirga massiliensis]|uniref:hypothetical protein n=1 Tax=Microvirga massiliensis TaxID=1033741 RepID=UPI00062BABA2|nr:hypothetical protein [Microvirga massiliensis]